LIILHKQCRAIHCRFISNFEIQLFAVRVSLFLEKKMSINTREAKALITMVESLLDSLDQTFDSLPFEIDQKVKDAKLTLLNVDTKDEKESRFTRFFR